jgi:hypothetical protein
MLVKFGSLCSDSLEESSLFLQWTVRLWKWWLACRKGIGKYDRKGFDTFGLLIAWSLWRERNSHMFSALAVQPQALVEQIRGSRRLWLAAGFSGLARFL